MRTAHNLTAALAVVIASLALAATATAKTVTETATAPLSSGGSVNAVLSYTTTNSIYDTNITLTITRDGAQVLDDAPVTSKLCPSECTVSEGNETKAIHVVDVVGTGEPVVWVDLFTAGANCCSLSEFYSYDPSTQSYVEHQQDWGVSGYELKRVGGEYLFDTANTAFSTVFTDFAASGLPLELLRFNGASFTNVTRSYPSLIRQDAARYLKAYRAEAPQYSDTVGVIAAWAADEDELGKSAAVAAYLKQQAAAGHLKSAIYPALKGTAFITKLDRFLKAEGYLR